MKESLCRWPVNFASRPSTSVLKGEEKDLDMLLILPFVSTYHPPVQNLEQVVLENWSLIKKLAIAENN